MQRLNSAGMDFLFRIRLHSEYTQDIAIIEIDDNNVSKVGRWPWNREWHGAVTKALKVLGASQIYFDVIFSEHAPGEGDKVFEEAIKYANNVYLPFAFEGQSFDIDDTIYPIEEFSSGAKGTGSINIYPDLDGALRKVPLFFVGPEGKVYPHISLKVAMDYLGAHIERVESNKLILSGPKGEVVIPLVDGNKMYINWLGKWVDTFHHYSFLDILTAYKNVLDKKPPGIYIKPLEGSICLIAVTAIGLYDIRTTPMEAEYPGVGTLATTMSNIIDKNFIVPLPFWVNWILIYLLGLIPFMFITGEKSLREILGVLLVGVAYVYFVVELFKNNYLVGLSLPLLSLSASYMGVATFHFVRVSVERQQFFKLAVTDGLTDLSNIRNFMTIINTEYQMAREQADKRFCVIMTDVDHFKHFNDTYGHKVGDLVLKGVAKALRDSVRASDLVARYGGEEIIILLRSSTIENAMVVAEKARNAVETCVVKDEDGKQYNVTISLGVAEYRSPDEPVDSIIKRADAGLYKAKEAGRNRVETVEEKPA